MTTTMTTGGETGDEPTGSGGAATTSGTSTGGEESSGGSTTSGTTGATEPGSTTGAGCIGCGPAFMGEKGDLCEEAEVLSDALFMCVCGACADVCQAQCTMNAPPSMACSTCQSDAFGGACARALMACLADG